METSVLDKNLIGIVSGNDDTGDEQAVDVRLVSRLVKRRHTGLFIDLDPGIGEQPMVGQVARHGEDVVGLESMFFTMLTIDDMMRFDPNDLRFELESHLVVTDE